MKKFIKQSTFFVLPIIILAYFIDVFISSKLRESNSHAQKEYPTWNALLDNQINSEIVIYGSSRAWTQFNPSTIFDSLNINTYNLGIDGHGFWLQNLRHILLLKQNTKPKLIIHSLDATTLTKGKDLYNADQFLPYMLWNEEIKNATISYNGYKLLDYYIPMLRYSGKFDAFKTVLKLIIKPQINSVQRVKGYQSQNRVWNKDFDKAKKTKNSYKVKLDSLSIYLFDQYLKDCKTNKIDLLFVYSPEYIDGQLFVNNRNKIINLYNYFSNKYNIPFFNYSKDSLSYNKKYFYNSTHLNKIGSELFMNSFISRLNNTNTTNKYINSIRSEN